MDQLVVWVSTGGKHHVLLIPLIEASRVAPVLLMPHDFRSNVRTVVGNQTIASRICAAVHGTLSPVSPMIQVVATVRPTFRGVAITYTLTIIQRYLMLTLFDQHKHEHGKYQ